jgi:PhnB protein
MNFYKECLNGEIKDLGRYGEAPIDSPEDFKDKVMHSRFVFGDNTIMVSDAMPHHGYSETSGSNIQMSVDVPDETELDSVFEKISKGGQVTMAMQDTFWGARFGMVTDKFGVKWMFNHDKKPENS